jgi:ribosomal 50S subunit-recycling heat shock protein
MSENIPPKPANSFRITLELYRAEKRLDTVLLQAIKKQNENLDLREISRTTYKELFNSGKIQIKGQKAKPSSSVAKGVTYVDIIGFKQK